MTDELTDELERLPRPAAPAELRERVLSAVSRELAHRKRRVPRWERAAEIAVAASLVLGVGMNVWQWRAQSPHFDRDAATQIAADDPLDKRGPLADRQAEEVIRRQFASLKRTDRASSLTLARQYHEILNRWIPTDSRRATSP